MTQVSGLESTQLAIMGRAAWSCLDDDALLSKTRSWLAEKSGMSVRSLERHEPLLAKLELLIRGDKGYRLPLFFAFDRQNGGPIERQVVRQIVRQNVGAQEEGILKKGRIQGRDPSLPHMTPNLNILRSRTTPRAVEQNTLNAIWGPIAKIGRQQNANVEPHFWDELRLVAVTAEVMRIQVMHRWPGWEREITKAAFAAGALRGRRIEIVLEEQLT